MKGCVEAREQRGSAGSEAHRPEWAQKDTAGGAAETVPAFVDGSVDVVAVNLHVVAVPVLVSPAAGGQGANH